MSKSFHIIEVPLGVTPWQAAGTVPPMPTRLSLPKPHDYEENAKTIVLQIDNFADYLKDASDDARLRYGVWPLTNDSRVLVLDQTGRCYELDGNAEYIKAPSVMQTLIKNFGEIEAQLPTSEMAINHNLTGEPPTPIIPPVESITDPVNDIPMQELPILPNPNPTVNLPTQENTAGEYTVSHIIDKSIDTSEDGKVQYKVR